MKRIAFVFPGQGAQYAGMGKEFYENYSVSKAVFEKASDVTGLDIAELCFTENDKLNVTEYTQIAMLACEAAILAAVREAGIVSEVNAGLSLGEYGALLASSVLTEDDAFRLVRTRGILMQSAYPEGGAMAAVIGFGSDKIEQICASTEGIVTIANYNCPGQIVITGEEEAVEKASMNLKEAGARRVIPLKVSGPFHSALLASAAEGLKKELEHISVNKPAVPYAANVTAELITEKEAIKELLSSQVTSSVRWQQCVEKMCSYGIDTFIEIGPGKTLTGFLRKIDRNAKAYNIETPQDLEKVMEELRHDGK